MLESRELNQLAPVHRVSPLEKIWVDFYQRGASVNTVWRNEYLLFYFYRNAIHVFLLKCIISNLECLLDADTGLQCPWHCDETDSHRLPSPVVEKGLHGPSSLEKSTPRPRLLLFWAHYIEDGSHLLCTGFL